MIYPWQENEWQRIVTMHQTNRLPHAFMMVGARGLGKKAFAEHLMQFLLCDTHTHCGACHACHLFSAGTHPNVLIIEPEKEQGAIKVDQIRALTEFVAHASFHDAHRFVLIQDANQMNVSAANALLKTLEEPSSGAILILLCDQAGRLPATVRSRCHVMHFHAPLSLAESFLKTKLPNETRLPLLLSLSHGAPLAALALAENEMLALRENWLGGLFSVLNQEQSPMVLAESLQKESSLQILDFTFLLLKDILSYQFHPNTTLTHSDYKPDIAKLAKIPAKKWVFLLNRLEHLRKQWLHGVHLNKQLMLEGLLIDWLEVAA